MYPSSATYQAGFIIIYFLDEETESRGEKSLAQGHTVSKWQGPNLSSGSPAWGSWLVPAKLLSGAVTLGTLGWQAGTQARQRASQPGLKSQLLGFPAV